MLLQLVCEVKGHSAGMECHVTLWNVVSGLCSGGLELLFMKNLQQWFTHLSPTGWGKTLC